MSIETRLQKLEQAASNNRDTEVDIYIVGEKEVTTLGGENMTRAEFENLQKTWTKGDTVINVTEYDHDY